MKLDRYQSNQGASAEALNTVESLSDKKGILAHKMAGVYIAIIGGFLVHVAVFQYTQRNP